MVASTPHYTANAAGNALASQSLAASGNVTFDVDLSSAWEGQLMIEATFGTIAATAGLRIDFFQGFGSTPTYPTTNPTFSWTLPAVAGARQSPKFPLRTGRWRISLTNTDASNGLTAVRATNDVVDRIDTV
jgi:hypothetical protein